MGSSQSGTREIIINNPDDSSILEISQSVVDRIKGINLGERKNFESSNIEAHTPMYITSFQINKQIDNQIKKNDMYWENRLRRLQDEYAKIDELFNEEYQKAVTDADSHFAKIHLKNNEDVCLNTKKSIIDCFTKNKTQPLICSKEVEAFNECLSSRTGLLSKSY